MITPQELRRLTDEALARGENERTRQAQQRLRAEEEAKRASENRAAATLAQIPSKAHTAAVEGKLSVSVMRLEYSECGKPFGTRFDVCEPEWLKGAAKIVWDHCVDAKLNPTLEHWHDGMGINESFDIVIHW